MPHILGLASHNLGDIRLTSWDCIRSPLDGRWKVLIWWNLGILYPQSQQRISSCFAKRFFKILDGWSWSSDNSCRSTGHELLPPSNHCLMQAWQKACWQVIACTGDSRTSEQMEQTNSSSTWPPRKRSTSKPMTVAGAAAMIKAS